MRTARANSIQQSTMYLPPRDPSSASNSSSVTQKRMMLQRYESGCKLRRLNDVVEQGNAMQIQPNIRHENNLVPKSAAETQRLSAKSQLHNLCSMRHWKAPMYECCDEGPSQNKLYTAKATVEIKEGSQITVLECFGDPQPKKKIAFEQAAEAALWYLKNVGYALQSEKASGRQEQT